MQFIIVFLEEVLKGEPDLVKCAKKAYEGSLKKFHGWIVQGIFSVSSASCSPPPPFCQGALSSHIAWYPFVVLTPGWREPQEHNEWTRSQTVLEPVLLDLDRSPTCQPWGHCATHGPPENKPKNKLLQEQNNINPGWIFKSLRNWKLMKPWITMKDGNFVLNFELLKVTT